MLNNNHPIVEVIKSITSLSCPNSINFHCHTTCSDGSLEPIELFKQASTLGLKHIAITDHHSIYAYLTINNWLEHNNYSADATKLWTGIEISCLLKGCLVHVLGLGFDPLSSFLTSYLKGESVQGADLRAENVVKAIRNSNGISILAHPARYRLDFSTLINEANAIGIDGIETWYDYNMASIWQPSEQVCNSINKLAKKYNMLSTCGTDTHGYSLLGR